MEEDNILKIKEMKYQLEMNKEKFAAFQSSLYNTYRDIEALINSYLEIKPEYTKIISLWIIGTYFHPRFQSYPYLFLNAMRGSGKTRLLKIIQSLSKGGLLLNSLTEAILFRTKDTLCIDEFESMGRKGSDNLRELLNSAYKKGTKVMRMRKTNTKEGEKQVPEEFDVYRPVAMANIRGIDDVLADRSIIINLEKSNNPLKTKLIEDFDYNILFNKTRLNLIELYNIWCSLCSVDVLYEVYMEWNNYVKGNETTLYYTTSNTTITTLTTLINRFKQLKDSELTGRDLELTLPILSLTMLFDSDLTEDVFSEVLKIFSEISNQRREEEVVENMDISLIDMIAQELEVQYYVRIEDITQKFKDFLRSGEDWINNRYIGRALKRLGLIKSKRRMGHGTEVLLDYQKAKEKMKLFR